MFKLSKISKILILSIVLLLVCSCGCMAANTNSAPSNDTTKTEDKNTSGSSNLSVMNTDLYLAEDDVTISDVINGNAFVYAKNVTITGQIYGDLFVFASNITIAESALIANSLYVCGNTIVFHGQANDVYAFAQSFTSKENSYINRDLKLYGAQVTLNGLIQRDAYIAVANMAISESAQGIIGGNLHYSASKEQNIPKGAVIGKVEFSQFTTPEVTPGQIVLNYVIKFVRVLVYAIAIILFAVLVTSNFPAKATYCMSQKPFVSASIGILAFAAIPIVSIILLVTNFFTYVGIALLALYIFMLSITIAILGIAVGNYATNKFTKKQTKAKVILFSLAAVTVIWLLQLIPIIGGWISIFTVVFGFGILLYSIFLKKDISKLDTAQK